MADLSIRYLSPARLDDALLIESRVEDIRAASCRMVQRALRGDALLSEAKVRVGFVGSDGRPRRQPEAWRQAFAALASAQEGIS